VERNLLKINKKSSTVFEKKKKTEKNFFLQIKKIEKISKQNKMGNAKKGHNKTGCAKVIAQKKRASVILVLRYKYIFLLKHETKFCSKFKNKLRIIPASAEEQSLKFSI